MGASRCAGLQKYVEDRFRALIQGEFKGRRMQIYVAGKAAVPSGRQATPVDH